MVFAYPCGDRGLRTKGDNLLRFHLEFQETFLFSRMFTPDISCAHGIGGN